MLLPSAFMISIAPLFLGLAVVLVRTNAILVPSGDHCGWLSAVLVAVVFWVSCVRWLPSAFIVKMAMELRQMAPVGVHREDGDARRVFVDDRPERPREHDLLAVG